jgi:hypothetical protein
MKMANVYAGMMHHLLPGYKTNNHVYSSFYSSDFARWPARIRAPEAILVPDSLWSAPKPS